MRISDRYIGRQVLLGTLYAVAVLSIVLVLGNLFKEIQDLLVEKKAPIGLVLRFALKVLPLSLMYTLPWGFLSAVLLVFGRLSSDHEITSFRVAGISLARLSVPVFVIGAALSGVSIWLNGNVVPLSKASVQELLFEQAVRDPKSLLKPGEILGKFRNEKDEPLKKVLIEGSDGEWLTGFHLYNLPKSDDDETPRTYIYASKAALAVDGGKSQLRLALGDAYFEAQKPDGKFSPGFAKYAEYLVIDLEQEKEKRSEPKAMTNREIIDHLDAAPKLSRKKRTAHRMEVMKRLSFSMACFSFAFVAVPLGLSARRRDTSGGLVISLLLGAGYFLVTVLADEFKTESQAMLVLWAPNLACVLGGLFLFRRARFK